MNTNPPYKILKPTKLFLAALFVFLMVGVGNVGGATYTASQSGNWNNASTWGGSGVPGANDHVIIGSTWGSTVTLTGNITCTNITIKDGCFLDLNGYNFTSKGTTIFTNQAHIIGTTNGTRTLSLGSGISLSEGNSYIHTTGYNVTINGNLSIPSQGSVRTNGNNLTVHGNLTIAAQGYVTSGNGNITVNGNVSLTANGVYINVGSGNLNITGDFSCDGKNTTISWTSGNVSIGGNVEYFYDYGDNPSFNCTGTGWLMMNGSSKTFTVDAVHWANVVTIPKFRLGSSSITKAGSATLTISDSFDLNNQTFFTHSAGTINVTGTVVKSGLMEMAYTGTPSFIYSGGGNIAGGRYYNLTVQTNNVSIPCGTTIHTIGAFTNSRNITGPTTPGQYARVVNTNPVVNSGTIGASSSYIAFSKTISGGAVGTNVLQNSSKIAQCEAPIPTITPSQTTLSGYSYCQGSGPSNSQNFAISASNLTGSGNITVAGTTNYLVSKDNSTFRTSVSYPYAGGVITGQPKTVYVRLKAGLAADNYNNENITFTGGGLSSPATVSNSGKVNPLPVATFSYAGTPYCSSAANPSPTFSGGGVGGTFSSSPAGLNFVSAASGQVNLAASKPGTYTVTNTIAATGGCSVVTSSATVTINLDGSWTGALNADWNNTGNWACNQLPTLASNVIIANGKPHYPILSGGAEGAANNLSIENKASLTVIGNSLQIAGVISNGGNFIATEGTIELKGTSAQQIGHNVLTGNTIMNLTINNPAGVHLQGPLNVTGIVTALNGDLTSNGNLTLVSSSGQTAFIDGIGAGNVLGDVTMQRILPSAFGYKYFSSPFQAATVAEFAQEIDLGATFPNFYKYDENNSVDTSGVTNYTTGWVNYINPASPLEPLAGYAANFGANVSAPPITVNMTGEVNEGNLQIPLFNHNRVYTQGFNLVGNPYPSPIDWEATGWIKTNIDDALYFFNASGSQHAGVYSSYVNGETTGNGNNVIAAMQGFFVHVSDGAYPVSGTLGVTNAVRINNLNPVFKRAVIDNRTRLRFTASFDVKNAVEDAAVIYFENDARPRFEKEFDALKMTNTDVQVPNIYTLSPESMQLSINGMSLPVDSISKIPLGITTYTDGWVTLTADDISRLPAYMHIYLLDGETGKHRDLKQLPDYRFYLKAGEYKGRFTLVFSLSELIDYTAIAGKLFTLSRSGDYLKLKSNLPVSTRGNLMVTNLLGQVILRREVYGNETVDINQNVSTGVFVITLISGKFKHSEKIIMRTDYE